MRQLLRCCRTRVAVLIVLEVARLTRHYGNATPSRAGLANRCGCCERTITRNVRALEDAGWLTVARDPARRRPDGTYTRARTNLYRLHGPRNSCSHRRDTAVTSKPRRGCNSAAPRAVVPVYNPPDLFAAHGPPPDAVPPPWRTDPDWLERQRRGNG